MVVERSLFREPVVEIFPRKYSTHELDE